MYIIKIYIFCMDWGYIGFDFLVVNIEKEIWLKCYKINIFVVQKKVIIFFDIK